MSDQDLTPQVPGETAATEAEPTKKKPAAKAKEPGLPDQASINPEKITRAVLTKDGYVVPAGLGKKA